MRLIPNQEYPINGLYEIDHDFSNLGAVANIVLNPTRRRVLLIDRRDDNCLALPSGADALKPDREDLNKPLRSTLEAALHELQVDTGLVGVKIRPFQTYKEKSVDSRKVGYYYYIMDQHISDRVIFMPAPSRTPGKPPKRSPGWFPIDLILSGKITLPFEQGTAFRDFLKSPIFSSLA